MLVEWHKMPTCRYVGYRIEASLLLLSPRLNTTCSMCDKLRATMKSALEMHYQFNMGLHTYYTICSICCSL